MRTKQIIRDTMIDLMQEKNFFDVTVTELAKAAGISRTGFYNHYDSVFDVVQDIEDEFIKGIDRSYNVEVLLHDGFTRQNHDRIEEQVRYLQKNIKTVKALCGTYGDPAFQARLANRTDKILSKTFSEKKGTAPLDQELTSEFLAGGQWYIYRWCAFHEHEIKPDQLADVLGNMYNQVFDLFRG